MSVLGLDVGEKRIGLARSDELNFMAHAVSFLERKSDEELVHELQKMIDEFDIKTIVVGLPKTMKGESGTQAAKVLSLVERLKPYIQSPIVMWDERLTTVEAERALIRQDMSRARRKMKRDSIAAEIMLQSYLDFLKQKGTASDV